MQIERINKTRWKMVALGMCILFGAFLGMLSESFLTGIEFRCANVLTTLVLSPVTLSVGGGHFPAKEELRVFFAIQGLLTIPAIATVSVCAFRWNTLAGYSGLVLLVAWLYFGLLHRHAAIMSV